jgi:hypothetical protein
MRLHAGDRQGGRADLKKPLTLQQLGAIFDFSEDPNQEAAKRLLAAPFFFDLFSR